MRSGHLDIDLSAEPLLPMPRLQYSGPPFPYAEPAAAMPERRAIDWRSYWRSIDKRRWRVLLLALILTAIASIYVQAIPRVFRSTTTLLIESGKAKILSIEEVYNGVSQDREYYQTQVEILRSRDVALRTVNATKLWDEPEFDPRKPNRGWQTRIKDFFSPPPEPPPWTVERLADATVGKFLGSISIEPVRLSQLVKISFESTDRDLAAKIADATATSFIEADRDARLKLNLTATGLLQERLGSLRDRLLQSEHDLQQYRESAGLVGTSGSQGVAGQQLTDISQRLVSARVRRTELESAFQQMERLANGKDVSASVMLGQPGLAEARNRVSVASLQLEEVTRTLGERHARVIDARAALAAAQKQFELQTQAIVSSARSEMQAARETERALQVALGSARTAVQGVNRQEFQLSVLEREVQTNKQLYELLLSRTKETGVNTNLQGNVARIVDPASPGAAPVRPNKAFAVLMTLLVTLGSGAAICVVIDKFNRSLQGSAEAEERLHHPVIAALPVVHPSEGQSLNRLFLDNPRSNHAEGIRTARTSMLLSKIIVAHKLILVTSALRNEGKTTICTNLALAHAQSRRTLLIDCDLRNPQLGHRLGLPEGAKGIADFVQGNGDVTQCTHAIQGSALLVMPAGNVPENPEELLLSPLFRVALKSLAMRVDIVLIDSPSLDTCSDALIIAQQVNDTIFVVKANDTSHSVAQRGLERLHRVGASVLGLVLTNLDPPATWWPLRRQKDSPAFGESRLAGDTAIST